jgi:hypothetical protein
LEVETEIFGMSKTFTSVALISNLEGPRLQYVCDWIFGERLGVPYRCYTSVELVTDASAFVLCYDNCSTAHIPDLGLLGTKGTVMPECKWGFWKNLPVCFLSDWHTSIPFDIFSAVFFLISRLEEYDSMPPDKHGRFDVTQSCLFQNGILERPIVDEWIAAFAAYLEEQGLQTNCPNYHFLPTYDIDIAWSFRHKGLLRNFGGWVRDMISGRGKETIARVQVLLGRRADPFDSFSQLDEWHQQFTLTPLYFVLAGLRSDTYDKHILPSNPAMQQLIRRIAARYEFGLHPSYRSSDDTSLFEQERALLSEIIGRAIVKSRQHYIRFRLPEYFRFLCEQGIRDEYSMGYGTAFGFRAGTSNSFFWYDLLEDRIQPMRIHPFCFMDTTAKYELSLSVEAAFDRLEQMKVRIAATRGTLTTIFHNFSLGTDPAWKGWSEAYAQFLNEHR